MTHHILTLSSYLTNPLIELVNIIRKGGHAFINSEFFKAYEQAQMAKARYFIARSAYKELSALTDRELADIGVNRGDIYDISYQHAKTKVK